MDNDDIVNRIVDRNVEQLNFTGKALLGGNRSGQLPRAMNLPGSRPDGGMERADPKSLEVRTLLDQLQQADHALRAQLVDARHVIDNFERDMAKLENEIIKLESELRQSQMLKEHFETMIRQIATLVVNGTKDQPA